MKNKYTLASMVILGSMISGTANANNSIGYWYDTAGDIVRTNFGECWRTIDWSTSNAIAECEGKMPAKKAMVKVDGDADKDGVVDSKDQCSSTTRGAKVDAKGCEVDSDKDGVVDSKDKCPGTTSGVSVDSSGCEVIKDSDGDGIVDANDQCPDTAEGMVVNKDGCKLKASISLENVQFKTGTADLSGTSRTTLDKVAATLKENDHLSFEVAGHTDSTGNYKKNVSLSEARAQTVMKYLVDKGVSADSLTAKGYGPDRPVASNDTRDGRSKNRRVELGLQ